MMHKKDDTEVKAIRLSMELAPLLKKLGYDVEGDSLGVIAEMLRIEQMSIEEVTRERMALSGMTREQIEKSNKEI